MDLNATNPHGKYGSSSFEDQQNSLKPVLILTALLFLLVAPAPDSRDIAEMTSNFLIAKDYSGLMAAEESTKPAKEVKQE